MSCPVDHSSLPPKPSSSGASCPVDHSSIPRTGEAPSECPVDHKTHSSWRAFLPFASSAAEPSEPTGSSSSHDTPSTLADGTPLPSGGSVSSAPRTLSSARETSSIPRAGTGENWMYPSEAQFFAAMARKRHNPQAGDMRVVVPIHNAVNERAWTEILKWEEGKGADKCGGVKLVSFKGRPGDMTPRARWRTLMGYTAPFDRHDWVVDRCGVQTRYVIDFYSGRSVVAGMPSFYLDVRPALDSWDGFQMRAERFWGRWYGGLFGTSAQHPSASRPTAKPAST